jgi:hypothetical protein
LSYIDTDDGFYFDEVEPRSRGTSSVASQDSLNDAFTYGGHAGGTAYPMIRTLSAGNVSPNGTPIGTPTSSGTSGSGTPGSSWGTQPYPLVKSRSANAGTFLNMRRHVHTASYDTEFIQVSTHTPT